MTTTRAILRNLLPLAGLLLFGATACDGVVGTGAGQGGGPGGSGVVDGNGATPGNGNGATPGSGSGASPGDGNGGKGSAGPVNFAGKTDFTSFVSTGGTTGSFVPPSTKDVAVVRLTQSGLDAAMNDAKGLVPNTFSIPEASKDLGPATVTASNGTVTVHIDSLQTHLADGSLALTAKLTGSGTIKAEGSIFGASLSCDLTLDFDQVTAKANLGASVAGGKVKLDLSDTNLAIPDNGIHVSSSCSLVDRVSGVIDFIVNLLKPWWSDKLNSWVSDSLTPKIEDAVNGAIGDKTQLSGKAAGFDYKFSVGRVTIATAGLDVFADATLTYSAASTMKSCGQQGQGGSGTGRALSLAHAPAGQAVLGAAFDLVQQVLNGAWQGGLFCIDASTLTGLGIDPKPVTSLLGGGGSVDFRFKTPAAPVLGLAADGQSLALKLPGTILELEIGGGFQGSITFDLFAAFQVTQRDGHVYLEATDLGLENIQQSGTGDLPIPVDSLGAFVKTLALPLLNTSLGKLPLAPSVIPLPAQSLGAQSANGQAISVDAITLKPEGIYIGASLVGTN